MHEVESIRIEIGRFRGPRVTFFRRTEDRQAVSHRIEVSWKSLERLTDWIQDHRYDFVLDEIISGNDWIHMEFALG